MQFETEILTATGGRQENQDSVIYDQSGDVNWWMVADGLGGHRGGARAAQLATSKARESFQRHPAMIAASLSAQLQAGHDAIVLAGEEDGQLSFMRSTAVILCSNSRNALWAHAGDTRLYHFRNGRLLFQSEDHSVPRALANAGDIQPEEIRFHEDRNRLLRCLGKRGDFRPAVLGEPVTIAPGDAFLLCTDGFWEYVFEVEMAIDWAKAKNPGQWLAFMEARLLQRATGAFDNYTALAVFISHENQAT